MRDWEGLVRNKLAGLALDEVQREETVAELSSHLEETFEGFLRQGVGEEEASQRTLLQAGDWSVLRKRIQTARSKESNMTDRVKQLWLPGFLTLFLSMLLLMIIQFIGPKPLVVGTHGWRLIAPVAVIYVPWLVCLIPIGAMGAWLAWRAGGSQRALFLSTVFPVLPYTVLFLIAFPVSLILDDYVAHNVTLSGLLVGLVAWVLLPGAALLAGGLSVRLARLRRTTT